MPAPVALVVGGIAAGYLVLKETPGAPRGSTPPLENVPPTKNLSSLRYSRSGVHPGTAGMAAPYVDGGRKAITATQAAFQEAQKRIQAEYDALSKEAKQRGAAALNAELGTSLTGDESFEEAGAIVGAALGGVAAGAACAAAGLGALALGCKALGALAGAYLGKVVGEWMGDAWDDVEDWAGGQWDNLGDNVEDAYDWFADGMGIF